MDWMLMANQNGHIACTQGGESLAGLVEANRRGILAPDDVGILDATAHALKFSAFQELYFENRFPPEFEITPDPNLMNTPVMIHPKDLKKVPAPEKPLDKDDLEAFVKRVSEEIAQTLHLKKAGDI